MGALAVILFLCSGVAFIVGLKLLAKPETARKGNAVSALGMLAAIVGTVVQIIGERGESFSIESLTWIGIGLGIGALVGVPAARFVKMTAMPEMVALFNGFGGVASLLIGWAQMQQALEIRSGANANIAESETGTHLVDVLSAVGGGNGHFVAATIVAAILIGGVTFSGSIIAFAKLAGKISSKPVVYKGQHLVNAGLLLLAVACGVAFAWNPGLFPVVYLVIPIAMALGVAAVISIGGGDMPVVISLLNSYSGLAACAAGFAVGSELLIITGALVGASGLILTRIMCLAMNRSLANVLFSGFGSGAPAATSSGEPGEKRDANVLSPEQAYYILEAAQSVIIVPGYGMAVAQAQHAVKELTQLLAANGTEVRFAIHPVAGRMPGHMNVLLAEADVPYEQLVEPDDVNPSMETVDVAIVIGANDVVNPAALTDEASPIFGMPIVEVHRARQVFTLKRSMGSGYAGIENPLFFLDNNAMILGDAKQTVNALVDAFKAD
ncbi:MAG: NAD(P) transhydrogenase subunit beta [Phycisphaeraceae bacterium]|nr:MAG: NAD(P) transhydrogenase subunit beta [Phycisphaeraceae bacterium]